jgi:hypothetical protein
MGASKKGGVTIFGYEMRTACIVVAYVLLSSMMLIANKAAIRAVKAPALLLAAQVASSVIIIRLLGVTGVLKVEPLKWSIMRRIWLVPTSFL